jgi:N-6 DNA Methylase
VQCYRRLIERHLRKNPKPKPTELRELLVENIFGVERNEEACRVTELNLSLTLLDSIDALSLRNAHNFKLPTLRDKNIFECDFFTPNTEWRQSFAEKGFDWIIGNPPWTELKKKVGDDQPAADWIKTNKKEKPIVGNDIAEAFAWETASLLSPKGIAGLLLPASSLFQMKKDFRRAFFDKVHVSTVANFANLVEVLFAGRARLPAAALFFQKNKPKSQEEEPVYVFSPMVANQLANQPEKPGKQKKVWNIVINQSEIRALRRRDLKDGGNLPWKLAMWGSHRDGRLLRWVENNFPSFGSWVKKRPNWYAVQGPVLRHENVKEAIEQVTELIGERQLVVKTLRKTGRLYAFPTKSTSAIPKTHTNIREGRASALSACRPPHIVLSASRSYSVFRDDFLVVPAPHVGVSGPEKDADLLRVLSLYLSSNFAVYYEFFKSAQGVIKQNRSTLDTLRQLPTPLEKLLQPEEETTLQRLVEIQKELVVTEQNINLMEAPRRATIEKLEAEYNAIFERLLGFGENEHCLIEDLLHVRKHLDAGKYSEHAVRPPTIPEIQAYAEMLRNDLDDFLDENLGLRHEVLIVEDGYAGVVQIRHQKSAETIPARVVKANDPTARELQKARAALEPTLGQWLYFDRNLFITHDEAMYFFKPLQILWWTRSRGLLDSDRLIAEMLAPQGEHGDQ